MPNTTAGAQIAITRSVLDGGIKGVIEWSVERDKNGDGFLPIDPYSLVTENDYTAPDGSEGSVGTYDFSYITTIPEDAEVGDEYTYRFTSNDRPDIVIVRTSNVYTVIESSGVSALSLSISVGIGL